jgi:EmrB/QacA subfamily drug resistance transporter
MMSSATARRQRRAILVVVAVVLMMVVSAVSGLNVALPDLARETGATQSQLQWIVDAYTVVLAGLLLPAGAIGDRIGRRTVLLAGLVVFGAAAAAAFSLTDPGGLIAARAAMGVGAALVMPTTLSIITTSFPEEERGEAVGVWVGVAGGGAVLGLFASGLLLEWFAWNSFFALNVALALVAAVGTLLVVPSSREQHPMPLDVVGAVLSLLGIAALVLGVIEGPVRGWDDLLVVGGLALGVVGLVAFVAWESRQEHPMLDPRLFRLRGFSTGSMSLTVQFFAAFGFFFVVMQYLQLVVGRSALGAAATMLPLPFVLIPLARKAPGIAARVGLRVTAPLGLGSMAAGMLTLSLLGPELSYPVLLAGLVLFAVGMALAGAPATTAITASLPPAKQGVASAVNDTSREVGSALGIAVLGSVLNGTYRDELAASLADIPGLPMQAVDAATSSLATAQAVAAQAGPAGQRLADAAAEAFVAATNDATLAAAVVLGVAAVAVGALAPPARAVAPEHGGSTSPRR